MKIIRRINAKAAGSQKYFTGKPCRFGHVSERYVANGNCVTCQAKWAATEKEKQSRLVYRQANKTKQARYYVDWYLENKDRKLGYMRDYNQKIAAPKTRHKYKTDHIFSVTTRARARLSKAIQRFGYAKNGKTHELIGCSYKELAAHIESQFIEGMGWHNRDQWHIDHIVPIASAKSEIELLALFCFTNLQPLWAEENRRKGARLEVIK